MSIECKAPIASGHKAEGVHGKGAKTKTSGSDSAQDAGAVGFMAVLSAVEEAGPVSDQSDNNIALQSVDPLLVPASAATTIASVEPPTLQVPVAADDAPQSLTPQLPNVDDFAAACGLPLQGASDPDSEVNADPAGALAAVAALAGSAQNQLLTPAVASDSVAANVEAVVLPKDPPPVALTQSRDPSSKSAAAQLEAANSQSGEPISMKDFRRSLHKFKSDPSATAGKSGVQPMNNEGHQEHRDVRLLAAMDIQKLLQPVAQEEARVLPTIAREDKNSNEVSMFAKPAESNSTAPAPTVAGPDLTGSGFSAVTEVNAPIETQVAEQVQFWISNDVQNAEMQIDGLGEKAVEVSITMRGNEAHVAFRTDELLARGVLEGAEAHLRDMLGREGLVLTGMSVGTSGSNDAQSESRQQRQSERRQALVAPAAVSEGRMVRNSYGVAGRSLDLFV